MDRRSRADRPWVHRTTRVTSKCGFINGRQNPSEIRVTGTGWALAAQRSPGFSPGNPSDHGAVAGEVGAGRSTKSGVLAPEIRHQTVGRLLVLATAQRSPGFSPGNPLGADVGTEVEG